MAYYLYFSLTSSKNIMAFVLKKADKYLIMIYCGKFYFLICGFGKKEKEKIF